MQNHEHKPNRLAHALSPYLLQHAFNPVDWYEWGEEAFEKARTENKLILVSIGYSACHWCHVMAHESFEDEDVAKLMNEFFVCIKVDREELPDVDQLYMDACQLVNGSGGWPLNAFALPDKRPVHALTYMPKPQWQKLLRNIQSIWQSQPQTMHGYAEKLVEGIGNLSLPPGLNHVEDKVEVSPSAFTIFKEQYDEVFGGPNRAPKFPMPNNYMFLMQYGHLYHDPGAREMAYHTLKHMALGGIHDAVGGGFARYSVDNRWFAPHFEKMLYDNAQLIGLYSYAYALSGKEFYKSIGLQSLAFCNAELKAGNGLYYSAYDADSEGVEGLYYTYTYDELQEVLGKDATPFCQYFQCTREGNWEHSRNILYAIDTIDKAASSFEIDKKALGGIITNSLAKLKSYRDERIKPGLDDKCICSWNNLLLKAVADSALWLGDPTLAGEAELHARSILDNFYIDGKLMRISKNGITRIPAFLEDHATLVDGLISLYQATFNEDWLIKAKDICAQTVYYFLDEDKGFFRFSPEAQMIAKYDTSDDVINSGNSIMAHCLWKLSWYFDKQDWRDIAGNMLDSILPLLETSAPWYSNWASLQLMREKGTQQVILSAQDERRTILPLKDHYKSGNSILGFTGKETGIPLFQGKEYTGEELMYICDDFVCQAPKPF